MEVELLRARAQMNAAQTYDPAPSPSIRMENPSAWPEKPRRAFGRRPSYTSISSKVSSPETPGLASPLSEIQGVDQPPTYAQMSPTDPALSSDEKSIEVHPDFMGICTDGTVAWATQRKARESNTTIIGFNGVDEEAQERPMLPNTIYTGPLGGEHNGHQSRPSSFRAKRPKMNLVIPENQHKKTIAAIPRDSPSTDTIKKSPSIDSIATVNPRASVIAKAVRGLTASPAMSHSSESDGLISEDSTSTDSLLSKKPPKSLRPFSRSAPKYYASLQSSVEDVSNVPALCSSSVASLEDALEEEMTSCYSRQSLSSDAVTEPGMKMENGRPLSGTGSEAFSIVTPGQAGVYDEPVPSMPNIPSHIKEKYGIGDLSNKPLPPEPRDLQPPPLKLQTPSSIKAETASLKASGQSPSRLISRFAIAQSPRPESPASSLASRNQPPRPFESPLKGNALNSPSLKAKYAANDLDALDHAFQKAMPSKGKHMTLEEAEIALEFHLSTIAEWEECRPDSPIINSPVRLGGAPFYIPGKKRPAGSIKTVQQPPTRITGKRSSGYSAHVANQVKSPARSRASWASSYSGSHPGSYHRHSLAPDGKQMNWSLKAQKVLGRVITNEVPLKLAPSIQSRSLPQSPDHGNGDSDNEDKSPDPAILEIHKRLELLQMSQNADAARMHDEQFERFHRLDKGTDPAPTNYAELYPPPPIPEDSRSTTQCSSIRPKSTATIRSLASLAVSDIPELYANMPPSAATYAQLHADATERQISPSAAEAVLLHIMKSVENLQDLFACAVVSKGFYRTFKRHELDLMQTAVRKMSPAAWELREAVKPSAESSPVSSQSESGYTPATFLRCYTRDLYIMVALKSLMVARCSSFLRPQTIAALSGNNKSRSFDLDNAFWRVWTFCKIFGCNQGREGDLLAQIDWLKGGAMTRESSTAARSGLRIYESSGAMVSVFEAFGKGNCGGLEEWELWDMVEIWICLGVLIHGFLKDNNRGMARDYGIFDNSEIPEGDVAAEDVHMGRFCSGSIYFLADPLYRRMDALSYDPRSQRHSRSCSTFIAVWTRGF